MRPGLFFPVDPAPTPRSAAWPPPRASGTNAVRYGTMRENVLGAEGRHRRRRGRSARHPRAEVVGGLRPDPPASSAARGRSASSPRSTLRLHPTPEAMSAAVCPFPTLARAVDSVIADDPVRRPVARIELLDDAVDGRGQPPQRDSAKDAPTLFLEFHGTAAEVAEQAEAVQRDRARSTAGRLRLGGPTRERAPPPLGRPAPAYLAGLPLRPGARGLHDRRLRADLAARRVHQPRAATSTRPRILAPILGHVGDGNFHVHVLARARRRRPRWRRPSGSTSGSWSGRSRRTGTCTGEHGVGYGKSGYLVAERGREAVDAMRAVKAALDPEGLLNPGKVLPDP